MGLSEYQPGFVESLWAIQPHLEYLAFIDDVLDELGSRKEIEYIHTMLERGTGADRQLKVFRETGSLKAVVDYMAAETREGL